MMSHSVYAPEGLYMALNLCPFETVFESQDRSFTFKFTQFEGALCVRYCAHILPATSSSNVCVLMLYPKET